MRILVFVISSALSLSFIGSTFADEPMEVWPDLAPGETTRLKGEIQPYRENENPKITRVENVTRPTMTVHRPEKPNGTAVVILPGGGFIKVVPDLEGTEAADHFVRKGVTAFVLSYRTTADTKSPGWVKPLQDAQRAMALIRSQSDRWQLKKDRIGLVGFSAGGQVAARLLCDGGKLNYDPIDDVDKTSHRPDFSVLIYPWNMYDAEKDSLISGVVVPSDCPPTFLVHTDDDRSSSLGAVLFYAGLKKHKIPAELHVYVNGGHGYGTRPVKGSAISTWTNHATHWLETRGFATP